VDSRDVTARFAWCGRRPARAGLRATPVRTGRVLYAPLFLVFCLPQPVASHLGPRRSPRTSLTRSLTDAVPR
jgi:hypothetical protein